MGTSIVLFHVIFKHVYYCVNIVQVMIVLMDVVVSTGQSLGPLDSGDELASSQPVQGGHEPCGGVCDCAVVAGVNGLGLDGFEQRQHCGHQLRHGFGHQRSHLVHWRRTQLGRVSLLYTLHLQLLGFSCWWEERFFFFKQARHSI